MEDRLTVLVLRLLGHRWPRQIEAGEAVPDWADTDGIISLSRPVPTASRRWPSGSRRGSRPSSRA